MNILVTGAKGMVGTALVQQSEEHPGRQEPNPPRHLTSTKSMNATTWTTPEKLDDYCAEGGFRVQSGGCEPSENNPEDFMTGQLRLRFLRC